MSKLNSLILLVKSLSKSEKKALTLYSSQTEDRKLYMDLFDMIDRENYAGDESITKVFYEKYPKSSLRANVKYLFDLILQVVVDLNVKKDETYKLYNSYLKTKLLRERGLYDDSLSLIKETKEKAEDIGEYNLLLSLQQEELKGDLVDYFDHLSEEELFSKQQDINETLKIIRQINEQSFLYDMLRLKIEQQKSTDVDKPYIYSDLLISEMSLVSSLKNEIFDISRLHQLFQASYFISTGSYKSALNSFSELNKLYLENKKLWNNPPIYYVMVLEGVLESLKRMRLFDEMHTYQTQLLALAEKYPYVNFGIEVHAINFLYSVAPFMYRCEYEKCLDLIEEYREILINKVLSLPPRLLLSVTICLSGIQLMNKNLTKARKLLAPIMRNNTFAGLKLFRSAQLLNLLIYNELGDSEYVESIIRSIKRNNRHLNKETQIERLLFRFLATEWKILSKEQEKSLREEFENDILNIRYSIADLQLLKAFDFSEWILTKVR